MNLYFELSPCFVEKHTNIVVYDVDPISAFPPLARKLMDRADRVWRETERGISFIKHRYMSPDSPVDMKEFMWVKLKSETV